MRKPWWTWVWWRSQSSPEFAALRQFAPVAGVRAAAVYARFSSDTEGKALGVTRQLEDCRRLAGQLGWTIAQEYVDNDLSAYSGKHRPAYQQLLTDVADGLRDAVICYHVVRLTR